MSIYNVQYWGNKKQNRAVRFSYDNNGNLFNALIVEEREGNQELGAPVFHIVGSDDSNAMQLIHAFKSFGNQLTEREFNDICHSVMQSLIDFDRSTIILKNKVLNNK